MDLKVANLFAGLSWTTAIGLALEGVDKVLQPNSTEHETLTWLIKILLAGAVALIGYYCREIAKTINETSKRIADAEQRLDDHDLIIEMWAKSLSEELNARTQDGTTIGRRSTDRMMAALVDTINKIQDRRKEKP